MDKDQRRAARLYFRKNKPSNDVIISYADLDGVFRPKLLAKRVVRTYDTYEELFRSKLQQQIQAIVNELFRKG